MWANTHTSGMGVRIEEGAKQLQNRRINKRLNLWKWPNSRDDDLCISLVILLNKLNVYDRNLVRYTICKLHTPCTMEFPRGLLIFTFYQPIHFRVCMVCTNRCGTLYFTLFRRPHQKNDRIRVPSWIKKEACMLPSSKSNISFTNHLSGWIS